MTTAIVTAAVVVAVMWPHRVPPASSPNPAVVAVGPSSAVVEIQSPGGDPGQPSRWLLPVSGSIIDFYRPPTHRFGAGNRGLEFAVGVGAEVTAVAGGTVSFAGQVGLDFHVVVDHHHGLKSGYSHLEDVDVQAGDAVAPGEMVGRASGRFHLSARLAPGIESPGLRPWGPRRYVDPLPLLGLDVRIRLVPV